MRALVLVAIVFLVAPASANKAAPADVAPEARSVATLVAETASRELPAGLTVTEIVVPETLLALDADAVSLSWRSAPRIGWSTVACRVMGAGEELGRGWVRLHIVELRPVLVARRALMAGTSLGAGDVALELRPVDRTTGWSFDARLLLGAPVLRDVAAGALLDETAVSPPPPVARGTAVDVLFQRGPVVIRARGVLETAARPGEHAAVRLDSRRLVKGTLTGDDTVVIQGEPL